MNKQHNPNPELPEKYKNRDYSIEVLLLVEIDDTKEYFIARYDYRHNRWIERGDWEPFTNPILAWWNLPVYSVE